MFTKGTAPQRLTDTSADQRAPLGSMYIDDDGRVFRYAQAGATALVGMALVQSNTTYTTSHIAGKTTSVPRTGETFNKGSNSIGFTTTTTSTAANAFAEGYVGQITSGAGYIDQVAGHPALTASTASDIRFKHNAPNGNNATGSTRGFLYPNLYQGVIVAPTSITKPVLGIPQWDVEANYYFWMLVRGLGGCRRDDTPVEGDMLMPSPTTAGALTPWVLTVPAGTDAAGGTLTPGQQFPIAFTVAYASGATHGALCLLNLP